VKTIPLSTARGNRLECAARRSTPYALLLVTLRHAERLERRPWTLSASRELDLAIVRFESASAAAWVQS
jgi:hypothetical protein